MANIKQQKKRIRTDAEKNLRNKSFKSKMKTAYKKAVLALEKNDQQQTEQLRLAVKLLDQAKARKIKHANYVNRKKSQLHRLNNQILTKTNAVAEQKNHSAESKIAKEIKE